MENQQSGTSDGISQSDWEGITEIAFRLADALLREDRQAETEERDALLTALDVLQDKYGDRPSILASRAEFLDDKNESIALYEKAYSLADETNDFQNKTFVASSLASLHWHVLEDRQNAELWLERLKDCLRDYTDDNEQDTYHALRRDLISVVKE